MSARVVNDTVIGKFANSFCIPIVLLPDGNSRVRCLIILSKYILKMFHAKGETTMAKSNPYAGTKTEKNLEAAFAGESQARNKYR